MAITISLTGRLADITSRPVGQITSAYIKTPVATVGQGLDITLSQPVPVVFDADGVFTVDVVDGLGWLFVQGVGWTESVRFVAAAGMTQMWEAIVNAMPESTGFSRYIQNMQAADAAVSEALAAATTATSQADRSSSEADRAASLLSTKADVVHTHSIGQVTGLQTALDGKASLVGGLIPTSQLPAVALTKPQVVADRAGMLALTAQEGDVAVITAGADKGTYMLGPGSPTVFESWVALATPTDAVTSVNGQTGVVQLAAGNIGAAPSAHTHSYSDISTKTVYPDGSSPNSVVITGTNGWFALRNDPTDGTHPARKNYVDTSIINSPKLHTWNGIGSWVAPANAGPNDIVLNTATKEIFSVKVV